LAEAFDARHALIGKLDETREYVRVVGRSPVREASPNGYRASSAPIMKLSRSRKTWSTADARGDFASHPEFDAASKGYLGTAIVSPAGEVIGVVEVWDERTITVGAESQRILEMFANRIGTEMSRIATESELRQLTSTLEARITARTAELAQVNEELEAFSYSVSHDLRTPVRAIDAHATLLREMPVAQSDAAARKHVDRIADAARRMRELIDGLLTLARLSHQQQDIQRVVLSVLAEQAIELLRDKDRTRQVEFVCAQNVSAYADPTGASIILTNLLENAWKYSSREACARIEFGCRVDDAEQVYFVRDNGVGFDMQHAKHMFEPFRRLHSHSDFPGSGVGLATVRRIVKRHNGRIWAESAQGEGATFHFTLSRSSSQPL
jgi:signal transduction histidine kinase